MGFKLSASRNQAGNTVSGSGQSQGSGFMSTLQSFVARTPTTTNSGQGSSTDVSKRLPTNVSNEGS